MELREHILKILPEYYDAVVRRYSRKRGMNVSLVYNNKKLIGKCSKFAIEKVQGTSPFVMLENFEPKQPQLNENQQIVLEWLKDLYGCHYYQPFVAVSLFRHSFWTEKIEENYNQLDRKQQAQVLEVFSRWAQEQEEE